MYYQSHLNLGKCYWHHYGLLFLYSDAFLNLPCFLSVVGGDLWRLSCDIKSIIKHLMSISCLRVTVRRRDEKDTQEVGWEKGWARRQDKQGMRTLKRIVPLKSMSCKVCKKEETNSPDLIFLPSLPQSAQGGAAGCVFYTQPTDQST